jgi:phage terminase large subunit GpA-like protein
MTSPKVWFWLSIKTDQKLSVSTWADEHRFLSTHASAEAGKYRSSRTPYMIEIMETLSQDCPTKKIVFMKSAQVGASETGNNWIGYIIDYAPAPTMIVQPTVDLAKRFTKQRLDPMIDETPRLREKVAERKDKDSSNTLSQKDFTGGTLIITGANSSSGLRSAPIKNLFLDEVDAYPLDLDGEGSAIDLAIARQRTFSRRKTFLASTPTIEGQSVIAKEFEGSDKRFCLVPCPECGGMQKLEFKNLIWPENEPEKAKYKCEFCSYLIENWQKTDMIKACKWQKTQESDVAGFFINSLYSPVGWYSWGELASDFVKAKKKGQETLKTFVNTVLGETWKEKTERPDWQRLYERREKYKIGTVPEGGLFLTAGVDIQKDRIECEIVAWGRNKNSWSVDYRVLLGDTSQEAVWVELEKIVHELFPMENEPTMSLPIKLMCVDSGFNTQVVYNWARKFSNTKVIPVKGRETLETLVSRPMNVDVTVRGDKPIRGQKVWHVGVNLIKAELYGFLRLPRTEVIPYGYCFFPEYGEEYFRMLTSEVVVEKIIRGYKRIEWQKITERNEALDCRVYARAAASICGIDRMSEEKLKQLESEQVPWVKVPENQNQCQNPKPQSQPSQVIKRRPSNWL